MLSGLHMVFFNLVTFFLESAFEQPEVKRGGL